VSKSNRGNKKNTSNAYKLTFFKPFFKPFFSVVSGSRPTVSLLSASYQRWDRFNETPFRAKKFAGKFLAQNFGQNQTQKQHMKNSR
jgi:hypothetical protein